MDRNGRFMQRRPIRLLEWEEDEAGRVMVLRPRLGRSPVGKWISSRLPDPYYRIRLDDIGTMVWKSCDGSASLSEIAEQMRRHFGERVDPAQERLKQFVHKMVRARLIRLE